jgi:leucyl-tRNA synthetase
MEVVSEPVEGDVELTEIDLWMLSRMQGAVREANEAMTEMKVRKTIHAALYNLNQDLDWYLKRVETQRSRGERRRAIQHVLGKVVETQVRLLTPFTPHLCEEIWEAMGKEGFVAFATWPKPDESMIRPDAEELESVIRSSIEDVQKIVQVTRITPGNVHFYTATAWKWKVYLKALELAEAGRLDIGTLIRESFKDDEVKVHASEVPAFARGVVDDVIKTPAGTVRRRLEMGVVSETNLFDDAKSFLEKEFGCNVEIGGESDPWIEDPEKRASRAKPYRPAIYVA